MKYLTLAAGLLSLGSALAQKVSTDGSCGGSGSITCQGSAFGNCCSQYGWVSRKYYNVRPCANYNYSVVLQPIIVLQAVSPNSVHAPVAIRLPRRSLQALPWSFAPRLDHLQQLLLHPRKSFLRMVLVVPTADQHVSDQGSGTVALRVDGVETQQRTAVLDVRQVLATAKTASSRPALPKHLRLLLPRALHLHYSA
jgi:hypothetical protein